MNTATQEPAVSPRSALPFAGAAHGPWPERLAYVLETMRELSRQTDPQKMVQTFGARMRQVIQSDANLSLSRRGLAPPFVRVTRSSRWTDPVNPWKSPGRLPVLDGGILGRIIWADEPVVIDDLDPPPDDPAAEHLAGMKSLVAVPLYDQGVALNMVVLMRKEPGAFDREFLPEHVWMANLFGRATNNLVLSDQLRRAYDAVDREMKAVADIQRSLLPSELPCVPTLQWAAHYQTSQRAGGDYYDFFPLPGGEWGVLIADVSGHGTPAAVLMAITHSIAHTCTDPANPPSRLLEFVNERLAAKYTAEMGNFVTALYGIYNPATRRLTYASAGHPPPLVRRAGAPGMRPRVEALAGTSGYPLGIEPGEAYPVQTAQLEPGDTLVLYTDGITEARTAADDLFGQERLEEALLDDALDALPGGPRDALESILAAVERFAGGRPPTDDRTLLVARVF